MRLLIIGGSDAGFSAALRAKQLSPETEVTVLLADSFPNYSICGLPFYISGETPDWRTPWPSRRSWPSGRSWRARRTGWSARRSRGTSSAASHSQQQWQGVDPNR